MSKTVYEEIIPSVTTLPKDELEEFASSVSDRFGNPYIDHKLLDIALNTTSKWRARVQPSLLDYHKRFQKLPECIVFSFAAYLAFYRNLKIEGAAASALRGDQSYVIRDDLWVLEFFAQHGAKNSAELVHAVCTNERMWGMDLTQLPGFEALVCEYLDEIAKNGMYSAIKNRI